MKYGDFLTNCDLMDLDSLNSLNQINDSNQANLKGLSEQAAKPNKTKALVTSRRPVKKVQPLTLLNRGKRLRNSKSTILKNTAQKEDTVLQGNVIINPDNTVNIGNLIETVKAKDPNSQTFVLNVSHVPIEFEKTKSNDKIQENIDQSIDVKVLDESKLLNDQSIDVKAFDEPKLLSDQSCTEPKLLNIQSNEVKVSNEPTLLDNNASRNVLKERKKIRIISEKKISEPVPIIGKLEPVSPTRILTFPNKRRFVNPNPIVEMPDLPIMNSSNTETTVTTDTSKDNIFVENAAREPIDIISSRSNHVLPQEIRTDVINLIPNEVLPDNAFENTRSYELNKTLASNILTSKVSPKTSLLKNKIPPERVAAIAEKRKFNMKLRDIIEDCLDKLDETDKSDFDKRKLAHKTRVMQNKQQKVASYLTKDPELPSVQDYTIAYLDARLKKMEDNLLNKIGENSKKIVELKQVVAPPCDKRNVHTQTSVSEDVHKRQLYQELSKYLSQEANSLVYEELFINKYAKDVPKCSSPKRRKRR